MTAIPRHPISPSPPFLASPSNQEGDGPRSPSPSSVSLSEEECKNSLEALSKLSRTPTAHPAAAALPLSLGPPGLVCLDRVELTSDAPRLLLPPPPPRLLRLLPTSAKLPTYRSTEARGELTIEAPSSSPSPSSRRQRRPQCLVELGMKGKRRRRRKKGRRRLNLLLRRGHRDRRRRCRGENGNDFCRPSQRSLVFLFLLFLLLSLWPDGDETTTPIAVAIGLIIDGSRP